MSPTVAQRFGRLIVLHRDDSRAGRYWICRCECGMEKSVRIYDLLDGKVRSCQCLRRELAAARHFKHGGKGTPEYRIWKNMTQRCLNPRNPAYKNYGGRGITVCERWRASFKAFLTDMGLRPGPAYSIDRIDNDGNYEPGNCRWATSSQQAQNCRRPYRMLTVDGVTKRLLDWAAECGINHSTIRYRLKRGWMAEQAIGMVGR